jgi:hypothetical protein
METNQPDISHTIEVPNLDNDQRPTNNPDLAVSWATISDPIQIEECLLARNIAHFGEAEGTLFTTRRLQERFGYEGVSNNVNNYSAALKNTSWIQI